MNRMVASFRGFVNRKSDKEPGPKSIWIGLQRLKDFTLAFELFNTQNIYGQGYEVSAREICEICCLI